MNLKKKSNQWEGCPYNVQAHREELAKDPNGPRSGYHITRMDRSYDWLYEQQNKVIRFMYLQGKTTEEILELQSKGELYPWPLEEREGAQL